jgi:hypothetical protein
MIEDYLSHIKQNFKIEIPLLTYKDQPLKISRLSASYINSVIELINDKPVISYPIIFIYNTLNHIIENNFAEDKDFKDYILNLHDQECLYLITYVMLFEYKDDLQDIWEDISKITTLDYSPDVDNEVIKEETFEMIIGFGSCSIKPKYDYITSLIESESNDNNWFILWQAWFIQEINFKPTSDTIEPKIFEEFDDICKIINLLKIDQFNRLITIRSNYLKKLSEYGYNFFQSIPTLSKMLVGNL